MKEEFNNLESRFIINNCKRFLDSIVPLIPENILTHRQKYILEVCISKNNFHSVAETCNLGTNYTSEIFKKSLRVASISCLKMKKDYDENFYSIQKENEFLKKENSMLKTEILKLNEKLNEKLAFDSLDKDSVLLISIYDTPMSVRLLNSLKANEIQILYDVLLYSRRDYLKFRNIGKKSIDELEEVLDEYGLKLKN
jgi:DNA-directed RNA polymerase alpha subunit